MSEVLLATSFTICAPMFSSASFNSISFATVTPSFVIVGEPNVLSRMTLRPFGPSVTRTALARLLIPRRMPCRDASPYTICFAMTKLLRLAFICPCQADLLPRVCRSDGVDDRAGEVRRAHHADRDFVVDAAHDGRRLSD